MNCAAAAAFCDTELTGLYFAQSTIIVSYCAYRADGCLFPERNIYNVGAACEGEFEETLCYPETKFVSQHFIKYKHLLTYNVELSKHT
jgi:hypothetical protein